MRVNRILSTFGSSAALLVAASVACSGQPEGETLRGTPGVASRSAVVNFAELARQAAPPAALPPDAGSPASAGFSSASVGGTPPSPAPASSFLAYEDDGVTDLPPPDTHGAVGPNHLMVVLNTKMRIQDRSGHVISTVAPSNFWAAVGPFSSTNVDGLFYVWVGDPRVLYDPFAGRWMVTAQADIIAAEPALLIGVSQTSDPTGNWNLYRLDVDPANKLIIDYPNVGFNKDWIVVEAVFYNVNSYTYQTLLGSRIYTFNKTNLYAGGSGLFTQFDTPNYGFAQVPATTYDTNLETMYLLGQVGIANNINSLRLYTITGTVGREVFTVGPTITSTNLWNNLPPVGFTGESLPQLGSPRKIQAGDSVIFGLAYRNGSL